MVAKSIAKMYTNIHKPTDYYSEPVNFVGDCTNSTSRLAVLPPDDQQYTY